MGIKSISLTAIVLTLSTSANAALVNGSFEDGLTGFIGSTGDQIGIIQSVAAGAIMPTDGNNLLYLTTGPGDLGNDGEVDNVTPGIRLDFTVDVGAEIRMMTTPR